MRALPAGAPARLEVDGIAKLYGDVRALEEVSLAVEPGEFLTILGPSGSGKTTLLKIVAGFELPDAGTVRLAGSDVTEATPAARNIGMVFQSYALFPHMSVADNIAFPLIMRKRPKAEIRERVAAAIGMVELTGYESRLPKQLSGGQQQRVALARAIVFQPALLLLDEPFGALDRKLREAMQLEVKHLQKRLGLTTVFITHDQEEALILSDRIAVMSRGRLEQVATPVEIYERPCNATVADFVGESNLLSGRIAAVEGGRAAVMVDGVGTLWAEAAGLALGAEAKLLVRPERVVLANGGAENRLAAEVAEIIYLGTSVKYQVRLESGRALTMRAGAAEPPLALGGRVELAVPASEIRIVGQGRPG